MSPIVRVSPISRGRIRCSFLLIGILVIAGTASARPLADIPLAHRVILPGAWRPTTAQTQQALRCVDAFLAQPESRDRWDLACIASILSDKGGFRVQFVGRRHKGRTVIYCNFFPAPERARKDQFPYWKQQEVEVMDGGPSFWRIDYDVKDDRCAEFSANGVG